ncbi:hypothetical protein OLMES_1711 [Oleiphilus messinensis]|uniref:Uncharacterized protein n=1 Tax=Oleiphilus messinensis TaxID=141451 RepID=A0A1Y0I7Q2_9GAMM|nr:hypothetical protein [Oleiphilus messinensis]ARU55786.1 hypothetical protein OLMES_1711 [Oleiphilus messinensis]
MTKASAYWGFVIDENLHTTAIKTVERIKTSESHDSKEINRKAAEIVSELTQFGLRSYYHKPTEIVPLHPVAKKTADTGIKAVMAGLDLVIKQFFKKRDAAEMRAISLYLENMLFQHPETGEFVLVFALHDELHGKAKQLLETVRSDGEKDGYIHDVIEALCELVDEGVRYYYQEPTSLINFGGFTKKTTDLSIAQVQKGIRSLIKKLISELNHEQLVELADHLESMIHDHESFVANGLSK